jgi:hypothetical protein
MKTLNNNLSVRLTMVYVFLEEMMETGANGEILTRKQRKKSFFTNISQLQEK